MAVYEELDFTNDFMFCKILENNEQLCTELLELILGRKIKKIIYLHKQETIEITSDGRGVRLDVYFEDDADTVYDLEMQTTLDKELPKRSRYYQGMIDLNLIQRGDNYKKLKKSYVIFICLQNPFDGRLHKYAFENRCIEDLNIRLGDDTTKVVITPDGTENDISEKMKHFLEYIVGKVPNDEFTKKLEYAVEEARNKEEWRLEYMTLLMRDQENIEKGRAEGRAEGMIATLIELVKDGILTVADAKRANLTETEMKKLL